MLRRLILAGTVSVAGGLGGLFLAAPAHADGQLCYTVQANVNGTPVNQSGCQAVPPAAPGTPGVPSLPAPPALP